MHLHLWCTKTLFTSFCRTDDIDRINNAIRQRETMGNITARGFITRLYSATVPTDSFMKKYINRAKLTASAFIHFIGNFIYQQHMNTNFFSEQFMYNNARGIHCYSQVLRITMISPIVLLQRTPPPVPCGYHIYVHPLSTNKGMRYKRCLFARFFFFNYH